MAMSEYGSESGSAYGISRKYGENVYINPYIRQ